MSESDEKPGTDDQQLPTPGTAPVAPEPEPKAAPEPTGSGRFAVYNETLEQYVGSVVDKKPTPAQAKAAVPKGHRATVREV